MKQQYFLKWQHAHYPLYYARWNNGEIDIVFLSPDQKPAWKVEIKWSNRVAENHRELKNIKTFSLDHELSEATVTTHDHIGTVKLNELEINFTPAALYCYAVGRNLITSKTRTIDFSR